MTWLEHHKVAEDYACDADTARWRGDLDVAQIAYAAAGRWEERALEYIDPADDDTYRIIAVSAIASWCKAKDYSYASRLAKAILERERVAATTKSEIKAMLGDIRKQRREHWRKSLLSLPSSMRRVAAAIPLALKAGSRLPEWLITLWR